MTDAEERENIREWLNDGDPGGNYDLRHLVNWAIDYARRGRTVEASALMLAVLDLPAHEAREVTDAEVEAAYREFVSESFKAPGAPAMRAALEAAREVAS